MRRAIIAAGRWVLLMGVFLAFAFYALTPRVKPREVVFRDISGQCWQFFLLPPVNGGTQAIGSVVQRSCP